MLRFPAQVDWEKVRKSLSNHECLEHPAVKSYWRTRDASSSLMGSTTASAEDATAQCTLLTDRCPNPWREAGLIFKGAQGVVVLSHCEIVDCS